MLKLSRHASYGPKPKSPENTGDGAVLVTVLGTLFNEALTTDLEPEFRYQYEDVGNSYREILTLLPLAIWKGEVTDASKRAALQRVVLRGHNSLTRFFTTVIKSPACASYVEELHCHVDLSQHTSAEQLNQDIALLSNVLMHLDQCLISLDVLISIKEHRMRDPGNEPYLPALDVRLRQAIFLSLLGHLRNLKTLRMTIHGSAYKTFAWLCLELPQHYPTELTKSVPCLNTCPSLKKIIFCASEDYTPSSIWHPLTLWPLIDLPEVEELQVENSPASYNATGAISGPDAVDDTTPSDDSDSNDDTSDEENDDIFTSLTTIRTLRIKNYLPITHTLRRVYSSFNMLQTLEICGSIPIQETTRVKAATDKVNLNTLLRITSVASTLRYLSIDDPNPTAHSARVLFGPSGELTGDCLVGLTALRALYIPFYAIFGGPFWKKEGMDGQGKTTFRLPEKLLRLEIVGDQGFSEGMANGEEAERRQARKTIHLLKCLARCCAQGKYFDLERVVLWSRKPGEGGSSRSVWEEDAMKEMFREVGVQFTRLPYERWPEDTVGGWRMLDEEFLGKRRG
jgi:hypothetical protein